MATLMTSFIIPAASANYCAAYVNTCNKLKLIIDIFTTQTVGTITFTDGIGSYNDPAIPYPFSQPVPLANQLNSYGVSVPLWSVSPTSYSPSALTDGRQQLEVIVDRTKGTSWLGIVIPANIAAPATVNIYMQDT